jgi:hypothetical protein
VAIAILTGTIAAIAQVQDHDPPPPEARPPVTAVGRELADAVGAFREPRTAEDALDAARAEYVRRIAPFGANPELSRKAASAGGRTVYLIPADGAVCTALAEASAGTSLGCQTLEDLETGAGGPAAVFGGCSAPSENEGPACRSVLLYDVLPDGVDHVTAGAGGSGRFSAGVVSNTYLLEIPTAVGPAVLRYETPSGSVTQPVPSLR